MACDSRYCEGRSHVFHAVYRGVCFGLFRKGGREGVLIDVDRWMMVRVKEGVLESRHALVEGSMLVFGIFCMC